MREGEYVSQQIEKSGIKVERLLWDRVKCVKTSYYSDPKDYLWHMYTEGWGAGATRAFWEHIVCQMYAPWYGMMAGGAEPEHWNYENVELDEYTQKAYTGNFLTVDEYWDLALNGLKLGLEDACRIYVIYQNQYYVANKERFNNRFCYGLGDGLNRWSIITADTKDKILKITEYSAKGGLFMSAWDPVGTEGFNDVYSLVLEEPLYDTGMFESPASAISTPLRTVPYDVETQVHKDEASGEIVGDITVPLEAIVYDSAKKEWVPVGEGVKAMSKGTYSFRFGNFHHGQSIGIADLLYAEAFAREWISQDGENDRYYNAPYESKLRPGIETIKGWVLDPDNTITTYFDYNFPPSKERVASWGAPWIAVTASGQPVGVSWEIIEALAQLVAEGSESETIYSFSPDSGTEVDLLTPSCVKDIRAKLVEMKEKNYVPVSIKDYISIEDARARYEAAIKWIDEHGHAFISCGPYYMEKYDPTTNYMELNAFRDPGYPFTPDYWPKVLATTRLQIDDLEVGSMFAKGEKIPVKIHVEEIQYPIDIPKLAEKGEVSIMFITPSQEYTYQAKYVEPGLFEATIDKEATKDLEAGSYSILASASMEGAVPASASAITVVY
jgi:peptide/nickel transport system substrate-binding protein